MFTKCDNEISNNYKRIKTTIISLPDVWYISFFQIDMTCIINFRMMYIKHIYIYIYINHMTLFITVIRDNINRFRVLAGLLVTGLVLRSVRYILSFTLVGKWGNLSEWHIWQSRHKVFNYISKRFRPFSTLITFLYHEIPAGVRHAR